MASLKKIYIAMSGGVDSSVAAYLLTKRGFQVVGVFMKPWQAPGVRCLWQVDRADALRVASHLGIPLKTWDFSAAYRKKVTADMIREYRAGRTPNPDVLCNKHIKFGLFFDRAMREGADMIATGHYARVDGKWSTVNGQLFCARDTKKDQTYFLWAIAKKALAKTRFPIGHLTKPQVRTIARRAGLPVADKKDSQGICFVGDMDVKSFLKKHITPKRGMIYHTNGTVLGEHDGAAYYTIGQRHGLDIKDGGGPYYVVRTDIKKNTIVVGSEKDLFSDTARISSGNWFGDKPNAGERVQVKVRYRTPAVPAVVGRGGLLRFQKPVRAITSGQSAVFYKGTRVLGGGIIR